MSHIHVHVYICIYSAVVFKKQDILNIFDGNIEWAGVFFTLNIYYYNGPVISLLCAQSKEIEVYAQMTL